MKIRGFRWIVLGLIVVVTIINYLDRGTLNYMWVANTKVVCPAGEYSYDEASASYETIVDGEPEVLAADEVKVLPDGSIEYLRYGGIAKELGLIDTAAPLEEQQRQSKSLLAVITMFFMVAYGVSQLVSGRIYDKVGTRRGFTLSALLWGGADALASLSTGLKSLISFRVLLGLGEAGPWPGTTKSNAEWFPQKERAFAQGIFGAAASVGSVIAPVLIPVLFLAFGWRTTFLVVGSLGILWVVPWLLINKKGPKDHPWVTDREREYILSGQPECRVSCDTAKTWGQLLSERKNYAVILGRFFLDPIWWMFVTWLPSMALAAVASSAVMAVVMMAFILGGYQFVMTNIQTLASDFQTGKAVGSLAGLGGASAVLGTIISILLVPYLTQSGVWTPFFVLGAALVPASLLCVFLFGGRIEQVRK